MNPTFAYLYDQTASDPRYERELASVEAELARRGIDGRIARESMFRDIQSTVKDLVKTGIRNVVVVGSDASFLQMIPLLSVLDVTIGFLPLGEAGAIAKMLGISSGVSATDVLAARLVETVDLGRVNERPFLTEAVLPATRASILIEGKYRLQPRESGAIGIRNLGSSAADGSASADPKDGWLELVIQTRPAKGAFARILSRGRLEETRIPFRNGRLDADEKVDLFVDGAVLSSETFAFAIQPKALRLITGRGRKIASPAIANPHVS